jgi:DNA polymerase elongation subunit (family B)
VNLYIYARKTENIDQIRRHDVPAFITFIKRFQTQLLYTLFDCKDSSEILSKGHENALVLVTQAIDTIMTGEGIDDKDLVISKLLRQDIQKYRSLFPHVSAAIQSRRYPLKGDTIQYISTDSKHDAAETVLGVFGFDRTVYSNNKTVRRKKWYEELREQRARDIETEMI